MEAITLADARDKLRWARHNFDVLRPQIEAFEQRDTHRFSVDIDADAGEYTFYVHDLEPVDPDWGLIIGDCIHNARTALDYTVVRLWALATNVNPSEVGELQFPICSAKIKPGATDADVEKAWTGARNSFKAFAAKVGNEVVFSGYLTRIEELQPFNSMNPSIWSRRGPHRELPMATLPNALDRLSWLDNIDKHRIPHAAWATINLWNAPSFDAVAPAGFKGGGSRTYRPLENDAQIGVWRFDTPLPHEWYPSEVDMKRCFPLQVAFGQQPSIFQGVIEVLELCLWGVEAVLAIFDRVFTDGKPPLPVTAIDEPRL